MMLRTIMEVEMVDHPHCDELIEFIDKEIVALEKKAEDAKKRAEKTKAANDELKERIFNILTVTDFMTTPEIIKALGDEGLSTQKVGARLSKLKEAGLVEKQDVKRPDPANEGKTKKLVGYRRIGDAHDTTFENMIDEVAETEDAED